ncbi:NAD(P)-binding protein [Mesorhizobium sp. ANAO-SY3R2]|uniref:NAD(P)-binding protein n=1 Tax=Mesorhizobium sp. ANAO-SY3R2 TaxID=3166644 RepID=UPI0036705E2F
MNWNDKDKKLGMDRPISRRDFLDGLAFTVGGAMAMRAFKPGAAQAQAGSGAAAYPPKADGLRGQTDAAQNVMHAVRDGSYWAKAGAVTPTGEHYDLVVVGAGLSGLTAAYTYRQQAGQDKRVLLIDPLEDFGGHAKRNEYVASNGQKIIGYGGSQSIDTPSFFSPAVHKLLSDVGIDLTRFETWFNQKWRDERGLSNRALFFFSEEWGQDKMVVRTKDTPAWVAQTPLNDKAKADLIALIDAPADYLPGLKREEKLQKLSDITYKQFLLDYAKADPQIGALYQITTMGYFGVGIDATSALDAWTNGSPGFDGMDLGEAVHKNMAPSGRVNFAGPDDYIHHFPEGNAGIARALVRGLIPAALPGSTMEEISTGTLDYSKLDVADHPVRIRLNSTAVKVAHDGSPGSAERVVVTYAGEGGKPFSVTGNHVVLACWNRVIPFLTDELPQEQVTALNDQQKVPLIYTNVLIRNWEAFDKLKIDRFAARGNFWSGASIDFPVSVGDYKFADKPSDPVVLHLTKVFAAPADTARDQFAAGRWELYSLTFEDMERSIRDMLNRALGAGGFDAARDIEAITLNRWAHGYAYEYMRPWDAYWPDGPLPIMTARKPWGRVAIANADSGAYAYAHSAMDQGIRAVRDLLGTPEGAPEYSRYPGPPLDKLGL